jgi:hypothetical protein
MTAFKTSMAMWTEVNAVAFSNDSIYVDKKI